MFSSISEKLNWGAIVWGWAVAIVTGILVNIIFEAAHVFVFSGNPLEPPNLTTALVAISLVSGFLAHFAGGYVAGRKSQAHGGLQGVMVAVLGFLFVVVAVAVVSAILVATAGIVLVEGGISFPTVTLGFAGGALLASLVLLIFNILGGYFGGKLGEWEIGPTGTSGGTSRTPTQSQRIR
ncbi:MAG: hypothetical protein ACFB50_06045 [Rubrobacteraceae bacterium]